MVSGQLNTATVVDLDGTYVSCNTLHVFIRVALRHIPLWRRAAVVSLIVARRLRLISHECMKYRALRLAGGEPAMLADFVTTVKAAVNPRVAAFIEERRAAGDRVLLASAASESYVPLLWDGEFIASPFGGPDLRGRRKADAVAAWLDARRLRIVHFLTDHSDDLPLAREAARRGATVHIINPTPESARALAEFR